MPDQDIEETTIPQKRLVKPVLVTADLVAVDVVKVVVNGDVLWKAKARDGAKTKLNFEISGKVESV